MGKALLKTQKNQLKRQLQQMFAACHNIRQASLLSNGCSAKKGCIGARAAGNAAGSYSSPLQ